MMLHTHTINIFFVCAFDADSTNTSFLCSLSFFSSSISVKKTIRLKPQTIVGTIVFFLTLSLTFCGVQEKKCNDFHTSERRAES